MCLLFFLYLFFTDFVVVVFGGFFAYIFSFSNLVVFGLVLVLFICCSGVVVVGLFVFCFAFFCARFLKLFS